MELCANLLYKIEQTCRLAVIKNFLAFFLFLFEQFPLLDPDLGGEMNVDPDPQPYRYLYRT